MIVAKTHDTASSANTLQALIDARHARHVADGGFTLVELVVTLLVLAILLAIAIPTFLGAARSANGRVAQANSNTALLDSLNSYYGAGQQYQPASAMTTALASAEKNLIFQVGASANHGQVSVYVAPDRNGIIMAVQSNTTKDCWYTIRNGRAEPATNGTPYRTLPNVELAAGTFFGEAKAPASGVAPRCQASAVLAAATGSVAYQKGAFPHL